jgi:hypothetical protein
MFPESFAEKWVSELSEPGDLVTDPFSGRGTAPFQALLMGRRAIACDINPVAYVLTRAKLRSPTLKALLDRADQLEEGYKSSRKRRTSYSHEFFKKAFDGDTYRQLTYVREELSWQTSDIDAMISAIILGGLHGDVSNAATYLSNQMPRTISTKPEYSVRFWQERNMVPPARDLFDVVRKRAVFRYESGRPRRKGSVHLGDMRDFGKRFIREKAHLLITSPPYLDTTSFEEDQWLRFWFLGGPDYPSRGRLSRDDRLYTRDSYWLMVSDLWRVIGQVMAPSSHAVIRIAGKGLTNEELVAGLVGTSVCSQRKVLLQSQAVSDIVRRQTDAFRPGSKGLRTEVDCHFMIA